VVAAALVVGCKAVGPDYVAPTVESPDRWRVEYPAAADAANTRWWEKFGDPVLDSLIETALRENPDVRIAVARIDQALGALVSTRSQYYPQIGYGADASRNRASEVGVPPLGPGTDPWYGLYQASLGAAWQIDLFGRVRRLEESAQAQVYATEQARRGVVQSLVASVAAGYVGLRALDRQLEIAQATARNFAETLRLFELRFSGGVVSAVEVAQIRSQYEQALSAIPTLESRIEQQENLISVLLGRDPGSIPRGLTIDRLMLPAIPEGLPSTLLERRPDILQAEQNLVAANAQIGAARALYYPTISLTGVLGSVSGALGDFRSASSAAVTLAAGLTGPIFTFGAIEGQVRSAEALREQALLTYRKTVLSAFREVNDSLIATRKSSETLAAQERRILALREYARLSRLRFDNGVASYLEVLIAENELFGAELTAVTTQADRASRLIDVYKAMGGGWIDEAGALAPPPTAETYTAPVVQR